MGWFKRLCLFVFGLAGILALAALVLPWVGPYTQQAAWLLLHEYNYQLAVLVVVGITALGVLVCFLRSIFSPRNRKVVVVSKIDGGEITVTRTAIASQAKHIVERDGTCVASATRVRARRRSVRVHMKVTPKHPLDVVQKGAQLHQELVDGLASVCGDTLKSVSLVFADPQDFAEPQQESYSDAYDYASYDNAARDEPPASSATDLGSADATTALAGGSAGAIGSASSSVEANAASLPSSEVPTPSASDGITVRLHSSHHADEGSELSEPQSETQPLPEVDSAANADSAPQAEPAAEVDSLSQPNSDEAEPDVPEAVDSTHTSPNDVAGPVPTSATVAPTEVLPTPGEGADSNEANDSTGKEGC